MAGLRCGIIGSGGMARARAERLAPHPRAQLACVASRNAATGQALAAAYGVPFLADWQALVARPDVDAVFLATHQDTHAPIGLAALAAGKHIFTESPLALRVEDADALVGGARERGLVLRVGHTSVLQGVHTLMKREAATLGDLLLATMHIHWPNRSERDPGFDMSISGHPFFVGVTLAFPLFDLCPDVAWVDGHCTFRNLDAAGRFDAAVAALQVGFARGAVGQVVYARGLAQPGSAGRRWLFTGGVLECREGDTYVRKDTAAGSTALPIPQVDAWQMEVEDFIAAVLDGTPLLVPPEAARRVVAIATAAVTSATNGRRVALTP